MQFFPLYLFNLKCIYLKMDLIYFNAYFVRGAYIKSETSYLRPIMNSRLQN